MHLFKQIIIFIGKQYISRVDARCHSYELGEGRKPWRRQPAKCHLPDVREILPGKIACRPVESQYN